MVLGIQDMIVTFENICENYNLWYMNMWYMVYDIWYMIYGIWHMVYGIWYMVHGTGI